MDSVKMRRAFNWTCEECGYDNYQRVTVVDGVNHWQSMVDDYGEAFAKSVQEWELIEQFVECWYCNCEFLADYGE